MNMPDECLSKQCDDCLQYEACLILQTFIKLAREALVKPARLVLDECLKNAQQAMPL